MTWESLYGAEPLPRKGPERVREILKVFLADKHATVTGLFKSLLDPFLNPSGAPFSKEEGNIVYRLSFTLSKEQRDCIFLNEEVSLSDWTEVWFASFSDPFKQITDITGTPPQLRMPLI